MDAGVRLDDILPVYKAFQYLGFFAFIALNLLYAVRRHLSDVANIFRLVERLKELHTKNQGTISSPHMDTYHQPVGKTR